MPVPPLRKKSGILKAQLRSFFLNDIGVNRNGFRRCVRVNRSTCFNRFDHLTQRNCADFRGVLRNRRGTRAADCTRSKGSHRRQGRVGPENSRHPGTRRKMRVSRALFRVQGQAVCGDVRSERDGPLPEPARGVARYLGRIWPELPIIFYFCSGESEKR